jgi:hypothetical protein
MKGTSVNLVRFSYEDIPGLISLSASVGWDYDEHGEQCLPLFAIEVSST